MNPFERYDYIINSIEDMILSDPYTSRKRITHDVLKRVGFTASDLKVIFKFFTDMSLVEYIRKRKMNYSYVKMKKLPKFKVEQIIDYTEYGDQPSYNKAFKKEFGMPPKQAYESPVNMQKQPLTIEVLQSIDYNNSDKSNLEESYKDVDAGKIINNNESTNQTIDQELANIREEYQELYGLGDVPVEIACDLFKSKEISLRDAFEEVLESYISCEEIIGADIEKLDKAEMINMFSIYEFVLGECRMYEMTLFEIIGLHRAVRPYGINILAEKRFISNYQETRTPLSTFINRYKFYLRNEGEFKDDEEITEFFENAGYFEDCESALEFIKSDRNSPFLCTEEDMHFDDYIEFE